MAARIGPARTAGISFFVHARVHLTRKTYLQTYPRADALQHIAASCNTTFRYGTSRHGRTAPASVISIRRPDISTTRGAYCRCGRASWPTEVSRVERNSLRRWIVHCGENGVTVRQVIPLMTSRAMRLSIGCSSKSARRSRRFNLAFAIRSGNASGIPARDDRQRRVPRPIFFASCERALA